MSLLHNSVRLIIGFVLSMTMLSASAQVFSDDFNDGDFSSSPEWTGNSSEFIVNPNDQLQLNDNAEGMSYLSSQIAETLAGDTEWRCFIKQSFSPSDNNNSRFYLMSSAGDLTYTGTGGATVNGYYLQFGEGGSDDAIELFRNDADGSKTSIAVGTAGFVSSSFEITVKVVRSSTGDWEIWADANAGEDYTLQATGSDDTYSAIDFTGWVCKYTSSNADNFFLDDVYIGDPVVDLEPPVLVNLQVNSSTQLTLEFDEPLEELSAETLTNYSVLGGFGNATVAEFIAPNTVELTFGSPFMSGVELTLNITEVEDVNGNAISEISEQFTYFDISEPQFGDLIINEIFPDPTPPVGLPDAEWFEILNTSENTFDLGDIDYFNSTTLNEIESYILPPGEFVIISSAAGTSALSAFGNTASASTFTALTNTQDSLTLSYNGTIIDVVVYDDDWYLDDVKSEGGWSLERINPQTQCSGAQNWIASASALGGTPGEMNSVFDDTADTEAPEIIAATLVNEILIFLEANEILDGGLQIENVELSNGIGISSLDLTSSGSGILIGLEAAVEIGEPFTITISELTDCEGNQSAFDFSFEIASGFPAEPGDVLITEIMADPSPEVGLPEVEYAELHNVTDVYIDISDADFSGATFTGTVILAPGEYRVIMNEDDIPGNFIFTGASGMEGWSSTFLTNSGKYLSLFSNGQDIDVVDYSSTWYQDADKDDGGWSLERINLEDPCSDISNWGASTSVFGGSPGEQNSLFDDSPDVTPPQVTLSYDFAGTLAIEFDEPLSEDSFDTVHFTVNGEEPFSVWNDGNTTVLITILDTPQAGELFTVEINGITDCWGNELNEETVIIGVAELPETGDIIINEVLSNPIDNGSDYVELYNHSDKVISLIDWNIARRDDDGLIASEQTIADFPLTLFPGDYLLLTESLENVAEVYPNSVTENFWVMDLPSFNNDAGDVVLMISGGEISDEFHYEDFYHFGLIDDTDGVSLERISFSVATQNPDNWSSASQTENYGTPGYKNSQSLDLLAATGEVSIDPDVFSPDNDGFQDNLAINYELAENNNIINITIYNKDGVEVRSLIDNEFVGQSGTYFWDGLNDAGEKLAVGIYVVYTEVFRLDGTVEGYKTPAVIAHF